MFRAAQKNKTKATQMMGTKDKKGAVSYHPGLLTNKQVLNTFKITQTLMCDSYLRGTMVFQY